MGSFAFMLYPAVKDTIFRSQHDKASVIIFSVFFLFFFIITFILLCYFLTTRTLKLTKEKLIINFLFLPLRKRIDFSDIKSITQERKIARPFFGGSFRPTYIFTDYYTIITLTNGKTYKTESVVQSDFEILLSAFRKLKSGQTNLSIKKRKLADYILSNLDGLPWLIVSLLITIGLVYNLIHKA